MKNLARILTPPDLLKRFRDDPTAVMAEHPMAGKHFESLQNLYKEAKQSSNPKKVIKKWLAKTFGKKPGLYKDFKRAIRAAKDSREEILREFGPELLRFPFTSDGVVRPMNDPWTILSFMWELDDPSANATVRFFELNLFWCLGIRYLMMEYEQEYRTDDAFLAKLTLKLEREFFCSPPHKNSGMADVRVLYDPQNFNRFVRLVTAKEQLTENVFHWTNLWYRFINCDGQIVTALHGSRAKREHDRFRKILLKSVAGSTIITDEYGINLTFFDRKDMERACDKLEKILFANHAAHIAYKENGNGDTQNAFSAEYHPEKHMKVMYRNRFLEVQIYLFENHYNRTFGLGPANHHFYRLRQFEPLLNLMAPPSLFGIDWSSTQIQQFMQMLQAARIQVNFAYNQQMRHIP